MLTLTKLASGLTILRPNSHFNIKSCPKILAPSYKTSIDLTTLSNLSLSGGLNVSGFSKAFSRPVAVCFILKT